MKTQEMTLMSGAAVLCSVIAQMLGGWDAALWTLVAFIAADYVSGVLVAAYNRELSSAVGFRGLLRKGGMLLVVVVAARLDALAGGGHGVRTTTCMFYIANEGLSILENTAKLGVPLPDAIVSALAALRGKKGA